MGTPATVSVPAAPTVTPDNQPFWKAAASGTLAIPHCDDCALPYWYPRARCPRCLGNQTRWIESAGVGEIYSFSAMRIGKGADAGTHVIAYVTLDEGVTLLTNLVDCDADQLRVGQRVRAVFKPAADGQAVPYFTLA